MSKSTTRKRKKNKISVCDPGVRVTHRDAAGIDIGSETHYVAVPADRDAKPVRTFGCLTPDLHELARWLKDCRIRTVAMESTGVYWIPVARVLEHHGLQVCLTDARQLRNVSGRKTDVCDCQWLQQLHSYGLLAGAFRPTPQLEVLRSYWRQRERLVNGSSRQIQRMQKALEQMNLQLHKVLSDIAGKTGQAIIRAIVGGERNPEYLVALCHQNCKRSREDFVKALTGYYREDHLFALEQTVELFDVYQEKLHALDQRIQRYMRSLEQQCDKDELAQRSDRKRRSTKRRKNQPHFDLRGELYALTGVDLTQIPGIDAMTAQTVITEQGIDMTQFPSDKHFASHLGLCPNHTITGGKIRKRRTRKVQSRAARALRIASQSLERNDSALGAFYRRMKGRHGPAKAITATAHKLAKLTYRMLKHGEDYVHTGQEQYERQYQKHRFKSLVKQARIMGYELLDVETGQVLS